MTKEYQDYAESGLKVLARADQTRWPPTYATATLRPARRDWLTAHSAVRDARRGAYDSFGNYDDEIDGRADARRGAAARSGPASTGWSTGLWHGQSAAN